MQSQRSRRSQQSLKVSHTQTSVPQGTLNNQLQQSIYLCHKTKISQYVRWTHFGRAKVKDHTMIHTYTPQPMSLPSVKLLHLMESKKQPGQDFKTHGHYDKVKGEIKVTPRQCTRTPPNQCPYQVSISYTLRFLRYCPDKILKVKVTTARSKVKSRSHHNVAHLQQLTNVPIKYQLVHLTISEI